MEEKLTVKTRDGQTWEIYVIMEFQVENYPDDYKLGVDKGVFKIFCDILTFS